MDTASCARPSKVARSCGIASKLGYNAACPAGGCALLDALGYELPSDRRDVCPVEDLAQGDNVIVLWTFDELRREMQRESAVLRTVDAEPAEATRHTDALLRRA